MIPYNFTTQLNIGDLVIEIEIDFNYEKEEQEVYSMPEASSPYYPPEVEITNVSSDNKIFDKSKLSEETWDYLEGKCFEFVDDE